MRNMIVIIARDFPHLAASLAETYHFMHLVIR